MEIHKFAIHQFQGGWNTVRESFVVSCNEQQSPRFFLDLLKQVDDLTAGLSVQVSGRFIG